MNYTIYTSAGQLSDNNTTIWATEETPTSLTDVAMAISTALQSTTDITMILNMSQSNYTEHGVISCSALVSAAPILGCMIGLLLVSLIVVSAGWVRSHQTMKKHKITLEQIR